MSNLAELLIKDLSQTMRTTLAPFIERMEHTDKQYKTLVTIMNSMPEFKKMMEENNLLKEELKRQAGPILEPVTLEPVTLVLEPVTLVLEPVTLVLEPVTLVLEPVTLVLEPVTLEITPLADNTPNTFNVTEHVKEIYDTFNAEDAIEEEEAIEVEEDASEAEEDASEVEEEDASEAEEDASEVEEEASEAEEEVEEDASEAEEESSEVEDSEEEVFIVEIDDVEYYTNDEVNGIIYSINVNEEVGENVGKFIDGEPTFL
jgi:hypothetical protein